MNSNENMYINYFILNLGLQNGKNTKMPAFSVLCALWQGWRFLVSYFPFPAAFPLVCAKSSFCGSYPFFMNPSTKSGDDGQPNLSQSGAGIKWVYFITLILTSNLIFIKPCVNIHKARYFKMNLRSNATSHKICVTTS